MTVLNVACIGHEEELAAFIDDQLPDEERQELIEHMANCDVCYEVFCATSQLLDEGDEIVEEEDSEGVVAAMPEPEKELGPADRKVLRPKVWWRRTPVWASSLAAAAVVAIVAAVAVMPAPQLDAKGIRSYELKSGVFPDGVTALSESAKLLLSTLVDPRWARFRSAQAELSSQTISFRIGVRTVDLDVALQADAREPAGEMVNDLTDLVEKDLILSRLPDPELRDKFLAIHARLEGDEHSSALLSETRSLTETIEAYLDTDPDYTLGKWSGSALLAATLKDRDFFENWRQRRMLRRLRKDLGEDAPPKFSGILALARSDLDADGFEQLHRELKAMIFARGARWS